MRACLDGGERRLILGSSLGEIVIFRSDIRVVRSSYHTHNQEVMDHTQIDVLHW